MIWARNVANMRKRHAYMVLVGKPDKKISEDLGVDGRIISK
jgi:hypothetical protein